MEKELEGQSAMPIASLLHRSAARDIGSQLCHGEVELENFGVGWTIQVGRITVGSKNRVEYRVQLSAKLERFQVQESGLPQHLYLQHES